MKKEEKIFIKLSKEMSKSDTPAQKCICTDLLNGNPEPVVNPDCPIHGSLNTEKGRIMKDAEKLRLLAEWFEREDVVQFIGPHSHGTEVQDDLRRIAKFLEDFHNEMHLVPD